jgi:hypothetical protein
MKPRWCIMLAALGLLIVPNLARAENVGANDFKNRCARCHTADKALGYMKAHPDAKERAAWPERKLARHHARNATQRKRIIQFLEATFSDKK